MNARTTGNRYEAKALSRFTVEWRPSLDGPNNKTVIHAMDAQHAVDHVRKTQTGHADMAILYVSKAIKRGWR